MNVIEEPKLQVLTIRLPSGEERAFYYRAGTSDDGVINRVFVDSAYDLRKLDRTKKQSRYADILGFLERARQQTGKRPLIVDAGANIGATPLYFLSEFPDASVVAIEPEPANFGLMQKNVAGADVECLHAAVSAHNGRARVLDPGEGHWGYRTEISSAGGVTCVTIGDIFRQKAATHFPFIVKIDIEGGEAELFSSNTEWVAQTPIIVVELHDWLIPKAAISQAFLKCVSQLDRDLINVGEDLYSILNNL